MWTNRVVEDFWLTIMNLMGRADYRRALGGLARTIFAHSPRAFVRVVSEDLKNDSGGVVDCARAGRHSTGIRCRSPWKVRDMLNDALQAIGGERRRR